MPTKKTQVNLTFDEMTFPRLNNAPNNAVTTNKATTPTAPLSSNEIELAMPALLYDYKATFPDRSINYLATYSGTVAYVLSMQQPLFFTNDHGGSGGGWQSYPSPTCTPATFYASCTPMTIDCLNFPGSNGGT